jgi:hypothetical protein
MLSSKGFTALRKNAVICLQRVVLCPWKKRRFMSSEGVSALGTKRRDMSSGGYPAHSVGCKSPLHVKMAVWSTFFYLNLLGHRNVHNTKIYIS